MPIARLVAFAFAAAFSTAAFAQFPFAPTAQPRYVADEVLIKFQDEATPEQRDAAYAAAGASAREHIFTRQMRGHGGTGVVRAEIRRSVREAIEDLSRMPGVEYAEPNWIYTHTAVSNDPYYTRGSLWGMYGGTTTPANVFGSGAGAAWAAGRTGSGTVYIGIIDEGVQVTHPDLAANAWTNPFDPVDGIDNDRNGYVDDKNGWDFSRNDNTVYDGKTDDHGTHVAGTIGGVGGNGQGVAGVAWNVKLISCKFLGGSGGTTTAAIKAVDYLTDLKLRHGLDIVASNNSWGGGGYSQGLYDAIERANGAGILFIAAAGNSGINTDASPSYPVCYSNSNIIGVAALSSNGGVPSWSNYGATTVDIGAPGNNIYSTVPSNSYGTMSGTSMATPHVSGACALYAAYNLGRGSVIKAAILGSVTPTPSLVGRCATGGRLNVSGF